MKGQHKEPTSSVTFFSPLSSLRRIHPVFDLSGQVEEGLRESSSGRFPKIEPSPMFSPATSVYDRRARTRPPKRVALTLFPGCLRIGESLPILELSEGRARARELAGDLVLSLLTVSLLPLYPLRPTTLPPLRSRPPTATFLSLRYELMAPAIIPCGLPRAVTTPHCSRVLIN